MMDQQIIPYLGKKKMNEITPSDVIQWQNEILQKGFSASYLRMIQNQLTSLFTHATKIYNLRNNPCSKVKKMGNFDSKSLNFWTLDEYKKFIDTIDKDTMYYILFEILFWTGCRIGEALALTKSDFDFDKKQMSITKTYYRTDMKDIISEPKTKQSVRTIELPEFLAKEVSEFISRHYALPDDERIFPVMQEAVQHKMKRNIEKVNNLRHNEPPVR